MEESISEIEITEIRVSPFQPRRYFAEEEIEELAKSIEQVGIIQPPVVRRITQKDRVLYYELIAGERRWRGAIKAGLTKLPVIIRDSTDAQAAEASLIENIQRVDLNPMELAEAYRKLMEVFRLTQEEIAQRVGKKRSTVANYLRLLTLPLNICKSLQQGSISMGHAKAILSLESAELKEMLHQLVIQERLTVREAESEGAKIAAKSATKKGAKETKEEIIHIKDLEERLTTHFKTRVQIVASGKNRGKVVISYHSLDDLDRLAAVLD